ncbi:uncharacterized protein BDR25DRAFT_395436 [Lindgomyces ingoldianus]|uniref:Uncharacterized protein n=1 Tax=Lindgomyces ingoldianus TaxID=673940 RepID=A0ACB6QIN7_9PLEO|nr:uncharacterized protein BDR25DRAFT_395436 [Lindgomyces ingoldianus]KAF2466858.1 hypothetical protein BDR25DRAFT_395436 [Lindgomyces ingoldianus]
MWWREIVQMQGLIEALYLPKTTPKTWFRNYEARKGDNRLFGKLNALARDVERVESVREIKDVQRTFAQLAQFGKWRDMAALFSNNGSLQWGNETATGLAAIEKWLRVDAGAMDGIRSGSLDTMIAENGLVTLSANGRIGKARWNGLRFMGDGAGGTRIQGGIYENQYVLSNGLWKISLLHYYPLYSGPYVGGWRTSNGAVPIIPYHFVEQGVDPGVAIPLEVGEAPPAKASIEELAHRISRLNDEDAIRNIQHSYGFYVDRRMWADVVDLFASGSTVKIDGVGTYEGAAGVRQAMERMGPEGLTQGILNAHYIFDQIVEVDLNGREATSRGIEVGMIGNANTRTASWEFSVFRNDFVKEDGQWKLSSLEITPLIVADYYKGWGRGASARNSSRVPAFLDVAARSSRGVARDGPSGDLADLRRQLARSSAYDGAENVSNAYGFVIDDLHCDLMGDLFHTKGHKNSPFCGYYQGPHRNADACYTSWGRNHSALRPSISFHWRPQPVILVSEDGRSATLRAHLLQPSTSNSTSGTFRGAIYHDQMALEDGKWRLWSITIDEFYWQSKDWEKGWAGVDPRNASSPLPAPSALLTKYPPDVTLVQIGDREDGFQGGTGRFISWPEIQRMWFQYRNLVSGRVPEHYWPGCVPCQLKKEWSLSANGYQEPPTGPELANATVL